MIATWELFQSIINSCPSLFGGANEPPTEAKTFEAFFENTSDENKLYIDSFKLHPIKINVSFVMTPDIGVYSTRKQEKSTLISESGGGVITAFASFFRQVGILVLDLSSNITRAPILISATNYEHMLITESELTRILQKFYFQSIVSQVGVDIFSYQIKNISVPVLTRKCYFKF